MNHLVMYVVILMRAVTNMYLEFDLQSKSVPDPGKQPAIFAPLQPDLSARRTV